MSLTKITTPIETELYERLHKVVPWGLRRHLVGAVAKLLVEAVERDGPVVIGLILEGEYRLVYRPPAAVLSEGTRKSRSRVST